MTFRHQIIAALWVSGGFFTLMLCWMIYTTMPYSLPAPKIIGMIGVTTLFWWLAGSMIGRAVDQRVRLTILAMREKLDEGTTLRRRMEKQHIIVTQFAEQALPVTSALVEQADRISTQSLEFAQARSASMATEKLLATTDELSDEIQRLSDDARQSAAQADQLHHDLESLAAQQPHVAEQLHQLSRLAKQFNLLALNASIEGTRALDRTRGVGLLLQEMNQLGGRAERMASELQTHVGHVSDGAVRGSMAVQPLVGSTQSLVAGAETLALLTDEQWAEIEKLHQGVESGAVRDGSSNLRFKLMDSAQMLAEKTSLLKRSIDGLVQNLQAAA